MLTHQHHYQHHYQHHHQHHHHHPELHARAIANLMQHLHATGRLSSPSSYSIDAEVEEPVHLMGFGTGGHSLLRFVDQLLPSLLWLQDRVRAVILVNTVLKYGPSFKRTCKVAHNHNPYPIQK